MRRDSVSKSALIRVSLEQIVDTQWSGALQTLRWISRLDSSFRNVQRESSLTWASQGRYDRLIELGRPDSALDPHTARVIGYAWEQRGMPERAAEYYAAMATQMPNEPRAQVVYGRALADAKRLTEAIRVFARATDSLKSDADVRATAWLEMAKASVQLGKPATANAYLERARCAHPPVAESEEWQSVRLSARRNSGLDTLAKYRRQAANTAAPGLSSDAAAPCPRR